MAGLRYVLMAVLMLSLAACAPSEPTQVASNPTDIPIANANSVAVNEGFVAKVNGVGISTADYERAIERSVVSGFARDRSLEQTVFQDLINQELIRQGAPSLGIAISQADVEAEIAAQREMAGGEDAWRQSLVLNNYSEEEWFAAQEDALLTLQVRNKLIEPYLSDVEQVNARHIIVRSLEEAQSAMDRLNNGEGFATLAAEVSIDVTTRDAGGSLGWFARNELLYPNLEEVAFSLEVGQIAGPIQTIIGYHIIQTMDKAVRPVEIERLQNISPNIFNTWLDEQLRKSTIETFIQW